MASHSRFLFWGCSTLRCSESSVRLALRPRTVCHLRLRRRIGASSHSCLPQESTYLYGGHTSQCLLLLNNNTEVRRLQDPPRLCYRHRSRIYLVCVCVVCVRAHPMHLLIPMASEASSDSFQLVFRAQLSSKHSPFLGQGREKKCLETPAIIPRQRTGFLGGY